MVWRELPSEIKKYFDICEPYELDIYEGRPVPDYVREAFEKTKKWMWEQDQ